VRLKLLHLCIQYAKAVFRSPSSCIALRSFALSISTTATFTAFVAVLCLPRAVSLSLSLSLYIYIYIYVCVCVCVCISKGGRLPHVASYNTRERKYLLYCRQGLLVFKLY